LSAFSARHPEREDHQCQAASGDSCLGSYKQLFASGQPFTYDLTELGEYYLQYQRLMDHWHRVLPGFVLDVHYEEVVADLETQVRRMLDFCGLPFEKTA
jgi:hypothetical protein